MFFLHRHPQCVAFARDDSEAYFFHMDLGAYLMILLRGAISLGFSAKHHVPVEGWAERTRVTTGMLCVVIQEKEENKVKRRQLLLLPLAKLTLAALAVGTASHLAHRIHHDAISINDTNQRSSRLFSPPCQAWIFNSKSRIFLILHTSPIYPSSVHRTYFVDLLRREPTQGGIHVVASLDTSITGCNASSVFAIPLNHYFILTSFSQLNMRTCSKYSI